MLVLGSGLTKVLRYLEITESTWQPVDGVSRGTNLHAAG